MAQRVPPRRLMRALWRVHRAVLVLSGRRMGLTLPRPGRRTGMLQLHTVGRRSGKPRSVVLNYIEDGGNLVTLAGNAGAPSEPAWWLNLQARPDADVDLAGGQCRVVAREAAGEERQRLLTALRGHSPYAKVDQFLAERGRHTAVVVLARTPS